MHELLVIPAAAGRLHEAGPGPELLVSEVVRVREDGSEERTFPTIRALAQRFGISQSAVGKKRSEMIG